MIERFAAQLALAIIDRIAERARAYDADRDRSRLLLAASSIREWLRENRAGKAR